MDKLFLDDPDLYLSSNGQFNGYWVERDGSLTEGFLGGRGGPDLIDIYWDIKNKNAHVFHLWSGNGSIDNYVYSYEAYSKEYSSLKSFDFIQSIEGWIGEFDQFEPILASEKYGLFDIKTGAMVTDFVFDDYFIINEQIAMVSVNGNWRLVDKKGNYINDCMYDNPHTLHQESFGYSYQAFNEFNGYVVVKAADGKYGLLDSKGNQILKPEFKNMSYVSQDGLYWAQNETGTWDLMQLNIVP